MNFKSKVYLPAPLRKENNDRKLKFRARTFWNMAQYIQELKSYKKSQFENVQ